MSAVASRGSDLDRPSPPAVPPPTGRGMRGPRAIALVLVIMLVFGAIATAMTVSQQWRQTERLMAGGLREPAGVEWFPGEGIVVAERGSIPSDATATQQTQTGRLTWVSTGTTRRTLADDLPSQYDPTTGHVTGPVDVALGPNDRMLLLMGRCDAPLCQAIVTATDAGELGIAADLRAEAGSTQRDPSSLAVGNDGLVYVADAANDQILRVDLGLSPASVDVFATLPADSSPRGLAIAPDGSLLVAAHGPSATGAGAVLQVRADQTTTAIDNLNMPVAVGVDPEGRILVLEHATGTIGSGAPRPHTGRLLRVAPDQTDDRAVLSAGLDRPVDLTIVHDGRVYVTASGEEDQAGTTGRLFQIRRLGPQPTPRRI